MERWSSHQLRWVDRRRRFQSEELYFRFENIKPEMTIRHLGIDVAKAVGYISLEFRGNFWVKNLDMIVNRFYVVLWAINLGEFI